MPTLGIIGSGNIGSAIARLAVAADMNVVITNSRGPDSLQDLAAELGPLAKAGTVDDAAKLGDAVVLSIPLKAVPNLPEGVLRGKLVLDTSNYYPFRDGRIEDLLDSTVTTSELVHRTLGGARLVKAFNNITAAHIPQLARPGGAGDRTALPIAADDEQAKPRRRPSSTGSAMTRSTPERSPRAGGSSPRPPPTDASTSSIPRHPTSSCWTPVPAPPRLRRSSRRWPLPPG